MPRQPRPDLAGIPQHIVRRGNDRQACFLAEPDFVRYLTNLREAALRYGVAIHAYVLMTNRVDLLATPDAPGAVSQQQLRDHVRQQRAFGCSRFRQQIEAMLGRCMQTRGRGRPAAKSKSL